MPFLHLLADLENDHPTWLGGCDTESGPGTCGWPPVAVLLTRARVLMRAGARVHLRLTADDSDECTCACCSRGYDMAVRTIIAQRQPDEDWRTTPWAESWLVAAMNPGG